VTDQYVLEATDTPSRIVPTSRPHFVGSVVVIEIEAASGLTTTQVADYAAMRAFVRTDPGRLGKSASPSILTVLEAPVGASIPVTLTEWDMGFLKALYASDNQRYATQQRQDIRPRLDDELRARGPGEAD